MRVCFKCGCYLPDNSTTCPACKAQQKDGADKMPSYDQYDSHGMVYGTKLVHSIKRDKRGFEYERIEEIRVPYEMIHVWDGNEIVPVLRRLN